jgi:cysteine-rich repeat protein
MHRRALLASFALASLLAACGDDGSTTTSGGHGGESATSSSSSGSGGMGSSSSSSGSGGSGGIGGSGSGGGAGSGSGSGGGGGSGSGSGGGGNGGAGGSGGGPALDCGNQIINPGETCDDGNTKGGDGCSATCQLEPGTVCGDAVDLNAVAKPSADGLVYDGTTLGSSLMGFGAPACSGGGTTSPAVLHRYITGKQPARVTFESFDIGGALADTVLWAYLDCLDTKNEHACDDDSGDGPLSRLRTAVLPPQTPVFLVVAGYDAANTGPYELRIHEEPFLVNDVAGSCMAPTDAGPGSYAGTTLAASPSAENGSCTGGGPEAVYKLVLASAADVSLRVAPDTADLDLGLYLRASPCAGGAEIACADSNVGGYGEALDLPALPAGTYYVVVDGFSATDAGPFGLEIGARPVVDKGKPCDPTEKADRCADGTTCFDAGMGPVCQSRTVLLEEHFDASLGALSAVDANGDGKTWQLCDPAAGCPQDNTTGSVSGGAFALIKDEDGVNLDGEVLASGTLDATSFKHVLLAFDHNFDHWTQATDLARVDVSVAGGPWTPVQSYTLDAAGHVRIDLTSLAAGKKFAVRFFYDDQTAGGDSFAEEWRVDDVAVYGL